MPLLSHRGRRQHRSISPPFPLSRSLLVNVMVAVAVVAPLFLILRSLQKRLLVAYDKVRDRKDIAVLTRGQVLSEDLGVKLENVTLTDLGRAKRVTITKEATTIIEGAGPPADIAGRVKHLRTQIEETTSEYDRENLHKRLAKLVGGVAVIKVGAVTEAALKEKKARLEDALNATRAAVEEGVVPGGGLAYIRALPALEQLQLDGDRQVGVTIIKRALEEPMRQIALNAGVEGATVVQQVKAASDMIGYDAAADAYVDLREAGVLDPTKVSRTALQHAASVVGLLLLTEVLITE